MRATRRRAALAALGLCVGALGAQATVMVRLGLDELRARATAVTVVRVGASQAHWVGRYLHTDVDCTVERSLAGSVAERSTVRVRLPGGVLDGVGQRAEGAPELAAGARYVLFLQPALAQVCEPAAGPVEPAGQPVRACPGLWQVAGFGQGALPLASDGRVLPAAVSAHSAANSPGQSALRSVPPEGMSVEALVTAMQPSR